MMSDRQSLNACLEREPFVAFTLVTNHGSEVVISQPTLVTLGSSELYIDSPAAEDDNKPGTLQLIITLSQVTKLIYDDKNAA